jgi:hypothetical protein
VFFFTFGLILFPLISLLIKLTSKGPIFFKQERWGLNNEILICYKFRTMVQESEDVEGLGRPPHGMHAPAQCEAGDAGPAGGGQGDAAGPSRRAVAAAGGGGRWRLPASQL